MKKLKLIIADGNETFVNSLSKYILSSHLEDFIVCTFTDIHYLERYFEEANTHHDILLATADMLPNDEMLERVRVVVILSEDKYNSSTIDAEYKRIFKYQPGDTLISNIISIYYENTSEKTKFSLTNKTTKLIGVYSPIGGVGKSTIAVATAMLYSKLNKSSLYLSLEDVSSTPFYFDCSLQESMTNLIYYLKAKKENLHIKINGIKSTDRLTGVHYIKPPDNAFELEEILFEDIQNLLSEIRKMNAIDVVVMDLSTSFGFLNRNILKNCDEILFLLNEEPDAIKKIQLLFKERSFEEVLNSEMNPKITYINNTSKNNPQTSAELVNFKGCISIPRIINLLSWDGSRYILSINNELGNVLFEIVGESFKD